MYKTVLATEEFPQHHIAELNFGIYMLITNNLVLYNSIYSRKLVDVKIFQLKYLTDVIFLTGHKNLY